MNAYKYMHTYPSFQQLIRTVDSKLFTVVLTCPTHGLHALLPLLSFAIHLGNVAAGKVEKVSSVTLPLLRVVSRKGSKSEVTEVISGSRYSIT